MDRNYNGHRAISHRLKSAPTQDAVNEIITTWINEWHQEQSELIRRLGAAIKDNNFDEQCKMCGQLKVVTWKKFTGLGTIFKKLFHNIDEEDIQELQNKNLLDNQHCNI